MHLRFPVLDHAREAPLAPHGVRDEVVVDGGGRRLRDGPRRPPDVRHALEQVHHGNLGLHRPLHCGALAHRQPRRLLEVPPEEGALLLARQHALPLAVVARELAHRVGDVGEQERRLHVLEVDEADLPRVGVQQRVGRVGVIVARAHGEVVLERGDGPKEAFRVLRQLLDEAMQARLVLFAEPRQVLVLDLHGGLDEAPEEHVLRRVGRVGIPRRAPPPHRAAVVELRKRRGELATPRLVLLERRRRVADQELVREAVVAAAVHIHEGGDPELLRVAVDERLGALAELADDGVDVGLFVRRAVEDVRQAAGEVAHVDVVGRDGAQLRDALFDEVAHIVGARNGHRDSRDVRLQPRERPCGHG
mmetsp:Transcript_51810/g.159656  ORF Transcript_51810/g.159656 Transcript_51810/m.159656 type:complete len:362 (-) Transcript_51810:41-1126(-)